MKRRADIISDFAKILKNLLRETKASRTTLRLDLPSLDFHLDRVAAEVLAPGVNSLRNETSVDQRKSAAFRWLEKHRRVFVENDCLNADPEVAPGREVLEIYGLRSEMVVPLIRDGELMGCVSVHDTKGPRVWKDDEIAAIQEGCKNVQRVLDELEQAGEVRNP